MDVISHDPIPLRGPDAPPLDRIPGSFPLFFQSKLIQNPDLKRRFEAGEKVQLEAGNNTHPAYPFQILVPEQEHSDSQRLVEEFFTHHPEMGFTIPVHGNSTMGILATEGFGSTVNTLQTLHELQAAHEKAGISFLFLLSDHPSNRIKLQKDDKNNVLIQTPDSIGFTELSWVGNSLLKDSALKEAAAKQGAIFRVSKHILHHTPDNSQIAPLLKPNTSPIEVFTPGEKTHELMDLQALETATPNTEVTGYVLKTRPTEKNTNHEREHASEGTTIKVDFTGMSKIVAKGEDPGDFMLRLFEDIGTPLQEESQQAGFAFHPIIEGDALIVQRPSTETTPTNQLNNILKLQEKMNVRYLNAINTAIMNRDLDNIAEHTVGIKTFVDLSGETDKKKLQVLERTAESLAKTGGYSASFVLSERLPHQDEQALFENKRYEFVDAGLPDGKVIYRVAFPSLLEHKLEDVHKDLIENGSYHKIESVHEAVVKQAQQREFSDVPNNILAAATFLRELQIHGNDSKEMALLLMKEDQMFSAKTALWIRNLWMMIRNPGNKDYHLDDNDATKVLLTFRQLGQLDSHHGNP